MNFLSGLGKPAGCSEAVSSVCAVCPSLKHRLPVTKESNGGKVAYCGLRFWDGNENFGRLLLTEEKPAGNGVNINVGN